MSSPIIERQNQNGVGNGIAPAESRLARTHASDHSRFSNLLDTAKFEHLWRVATAFSKSDLVPAQFRGKPENCFIGIQMAIRLDVDPFMFLQSCYVVQGRPGIEAKLAIALANSSGVFIGPIRYRLAGEGKRRSCTAYATVRETREDIEMTVDWQMVEAEGWSKKNGSKWLTIPEVMFRYRSAMLLIRTHCPEVIMGMQSKEELEDTVSIPLSAAVVSQRPANLDSLTDRMMAVEEDVTAQTTAEQEAIDDTQQLAAGEIASDLSRFHDACLAATMIGEVAKADAELRGPNGRTLSDDEAVLADAWKADTEARIRNARGERSGKQEQKSLTD